MQILPPSCVLPCQADSHSLSLSAAFHLSAGEDVSRLKGQEMLQRAAGMFWLSSHQEKCYQKKRKRKKNTFLQRQRSVKRGQAGRLPRKEEGGGEQQQNSWLVAGTLQLNVWWVQLGWTEAETLRAENKPRTEPSTFSRFPSAQNSSLLRGTAFRSPRQHLAISGSDDEATIPETQNLNCLKDNETNVASVKVELMNLHWSI